MTRDGVVGMVVVSPPVSFIVATDTLITIARKWCVLTATSMQGQTVLITVMNANNYLLPVAHVLYEKVKKENWTVKNAPNELHLYSLMKVTDYTSRSGAVEG